MCSPCPAGRLCNGSNVTVCDSIATICNRTQYISSQCSSTSEFVCSPCQACTLGNYVSKPCPGNSTVADSNTCSACAACPAGKYLAVPCNGIAAVENKVGFMIHGFGFWALGLIVSSLLTMFAFWLWGHLSMLAFLMQFHQFKLSNRHSVFPQVCRNCSACSPGSYISAPCPGGGGAVAGNLSSTINVCASCGSSCGVGQYTDGCYTGTDGDNRSATCRACQACPVDQYIAAPCLGNGERILWQHFCQPSLMKTPPQVQAHPTGPARLAASVPPGSTFPKEVVPTATLPVVKSGVHRAMLVDRVLTNLATTVIVGFATSVPQSWENRTTSANRAVELVVIKRQGCVKNARALQGTSLFHSALEETVWT